MNTQNSAAAAPRIQGAAAAEISALRELFANVGYQTADMREMETLAVAEFPQCNPAGAFSSLLHQHTNGGPTWKGVREIWVSVQLWKKGFTAAPFDFLKFVGRAKNYAREIRRGRVTIEEIRAGEFYEQKSIAGFSNFYSPTKYYRTITPAGDELIFRHSDGFFCNLGGAYYPDTSTTTFHSVRTLWTGPGHKWTNEEIAESLQNLNRFGLRIGNPAFHSYEISDYCYHTFPGGLVYLESVGCIPADELPLWDAVYIEDLQEYRRRSDRGIYQHPDGKYYSQPFGIVCRPNEAVAGYHSGAGNSGGDCNKPVRFSRNSPLLTGWEIEKEDFQVKCSIRHRDFTAELPNFRKERDGSLNDDSGFEFITPPLELSAKGIEKYLKARPVAVAHINAAYSAKCGGHVHISRAGKSGLELFEEIRGYLPLLYALFPGRADGNNSHYCRAKSARDLISDREKYQAVNILNNRIEIRIFGAVKGLENLVWRAGLLQKIFAAPCNNVAEFYSVHLPGLICHLRKVYSTPEMLEKLIKRIEKYAAKFEGENLRVESSPRGLIHLSSGQIVVNGAACKEYLKARRPATYREILKSFKKSYSFI